MEVRSTDTLLTLPPLPEIEEAGGPLLVAVEATRLTREVRGIGRYVRALLPRLVSLRPGLRLALFAKGRRDAESLTAVLEAMPGMSGHFEVHSVRQMLGCGANVF